ncbi:c-type cytochrome [Jannaschia sp. Os4]|uniref:c-type cytochrome n=1 Tax=Jannaschia sp. Os4 TaxID=2807617 RepID=UPI00193A7C86|nr:c-type cytochrome [Jannaschia sp. Os4]MBM2575968.1 c-type cytochrome [Jannaschia sp. Os4]
MLAGEAPRPAAAQDLDAGRAVAGMCRTCHGLDGYARIPVAPHIGGEPEAYLAAQLAAFKSGAREHEMMSIVAATLSERQIADVAAWYAAPTATAVAPEGEAPTLCASCHGADGIAVVADAPNLAGEAAAYTVTQLKAFRSGARAHEAMSAIAADLSDAEMRAAADWYAAATLEIAPPG